MPSPESQLASTVLMVRPARFESNPLTAESNQFQSEPDASPSEQQARALAAFDALVETLRANAVDVIVAADTREPRCPDAVFPNNWLSTHADGRAVMYAMEAENRRTERRTDIIEALADEHGFQVSEIVDFSSHEAAGEFLEGTGSVVLDRVHRIAYACLSSRTHLEALGDFAQRMGYEIVAFEATDRNGQPIYHTNVMMSVGESLAIVCDESIADADQRRAVLESLASTGHEVLHLTIQQVAAFAGNMLELRNTRGERLVAMSQQAWESLDDDQQAKLRANGGVVTSPIDDIEFASGGSVRCMLAEIHLPKRAQQQ
jgi:hypothetical protein